MSAAAEQTNDEKTWGDKPWMSFLVRTAVFVVPILLSLGITWLVAGIWPAPTTVPGAMARFGALGLIAIAVATVADRGARKFLPLATLYRLSLVFPDQAPSRFSTALRSGHTKKIEQRLLEAEKGGFEGNQAEAAAFIIEMAAALSEHDRLTRGHSERVRAFTALLAEEMGLSAEDSNKLQWAGLIHDVGKLRIDQAILTKPGRLTKEEFDVIKTHPDEGMRIAEPLREYLGEWIGAVGEHHERYDGGGYPSGLAGTDISLGGRIVAVADAYDVITAARSYKKPLPPEFARQELAENAGTQFDPEVVRAFLGISLGRLRRAMWPLSWAAQLPFIGTAVATPVAQTVAAAVVTVGAAAGATAVTGGFEPLQAPEAIAMVDESGEQEDASIAAPNQEAAAPAGTEQPSPGPTTTVVSAPPAADGELVITTTTIEAPAAADPAPADPDAAKDTDPDDTAVDLGFDAPGEPRSSTTTVAPSSSVSSIAAPSPTRPRPVTTTTRPSAVTTTTRRPTTTTVRPTTTTRPVTTTTRAPTTTTTATPPVSAECRAAQNGESDLSWTSLEECDLSGLTLFEVNLSGANLDDADFSGATLIRPTFYRGSFHRADLTGATIDGGAITMADFTSAKFNNADISNISFNETNLTSANFSGATLTDVGFTSTLTSARFVGAWLTRTSFSGAVLSGANFTNAEMADSSFDHSNLSGMVLSGAEMFQVSFWQAVNTPSRTSTATFVDAVCPDGNIRNTSCW